MDKFEYDKYCKKCLFKKHIESDINYAECRLKLHMMENIECRQCPFFEFKTLGNFNRMDRYIIKKKSEVIDICKKDPALFIERVCGIKLKVWQKYFINKAVNKSSKKSTKNECDLNNDKK